MIQEAITLQNLLRDPNTMALGFDLAKERFHEPDVRSLLIKWYQEIRIWSLQSLPKGASPGGLVGRVERYLQIMEAIDNDGNRIEDSGDAIALGGHCGSRPGNAATPGQHYVWSSRLPGTGTV